MTIQAKRIALASLLCVGLVAGCAKSDSSMKQVSDTTKGSKGMKKSKNARAVTSKMNAEGVQVLEAATCQSVEQLIPKGTSDTFTADIGKLYFFTKIGLKGAEGSVKHVWHFNGKPIATVKLPVRGPSWRTYSSKNIAPFQKGKWRVDVVSESGDVLHASAFTIE